MLLGENTRALLRQKLAQDLLALDDMSGAGYTGYGTVAQDVIVGAGTATNALIDAISDPRIGEALKQAGFDFQIWAKLVEEGNVEAARSYTDNLTPAIQEVLAQNIANTEQTRLLVQAQYSARDGLDSVADSAQEVLDPLRKQLTISELLKTETEKLAEEEEKLDEIFKKVAESAFGPINAQNALQDSMRALG